MEGSDAAATAIEINNTSTGDPKINFQFGVSAPTFSIGIDNSDADKFKIGTSALETNTRLTIDASGNVGIGTTSPSTKLHLDGTFRLVDGNQSNGKVLTSDANGVATWQTASGGSLPAGTSGQTLRHDGTNWVANSTIFNNGTNVGIGTSSPTARLDVDGGVIFNKSKQRVNFTVRSELSDYMLNVDNTWNSVGINTSSPQYTLNVNGQPGANGYTAFTNYSDSRLKTNISSLDTGALSKIMQLRPVSFQYNQKYLQLYAGSDLQKVHKGFIAQEIRQVFPEMVSEMKTSPDSVQYLDLDVSHLQVYLVKALQEQQAIINAQKKENEAQKAEIDALKQNVLKVAELEIKMNAMLLLLNNKQELTVKQD